MTEESKDKFYAVSLLFKSSMPISDKDSFLWEDRIVLFVAADPSAAELKARNYGKAEEHEYLNSSNELVRWTFEHIESVVPIQIRALEDGTELFSRFLRDAEVRSILTPFEE